MSGSTQCGSQGYAGYLGHSRYDEKMAISPLPWCPSNGKGSYGKSYVLFPMDFGFVGITNYMFERLKGR